MRKRFARWTAARGLVVLVVAVLALVMAPGLLLAHQFLRSSVPSDGARLDAVPTEIRLTFSETARLDFTEVVVQGPDGLLDVGPVAADAADPRVVVAPVTGGWHAGSFVLRWTTVGSDGHRTSGTLAFQVAPDADGLPAPDPEPLEPAQDTAVVSMPHHDPRLFPETPSFGPGSPGYVGIRALLFVALVVLLGAVSLRLILMPMLGLRWSAEAAALRSEVDRGAAHLGMAAAGGLLAAALARLWAQSASLFGMDGALEPDRLAQALTLQPWAGGWWLQVAAALVALAGFALVPRAPVAGWALAAVAAIVAAGTPALSGHAVTTPGLAWLAVPVDLLHVAAAGGWIGGLLALVVVAIPAALRLDPALRGVTASALVQSFSPMALAFTATLVATGLVSAWLHVGQLPLLWTTGYGRTLLLKLTLFSTVGLLGAYNFMRVRPSTDGQQGAARLRRSGTIELVLALAVIVVTAVLVAVPPPGG
jgi:copper transport protein